MTCSMAVFWPSTTSVSRETCGSWVRPMVRLSIAKPRCRNRLTTRLSTDGWSSSVATSVCFIRDHLRQGGAGHHHREYVLVLDGLEFDQGRAGIGHGRPDGLVHLVRAGHPPGRDAVGLGQLHVIRDAR